MEWPNVDALQELLSPEQLDEWRAFDELEGRPITGDRLVGTLARGLAYLLQKDGIDMASWQLIPHGEPPPEPVADGAEITLAVERIVDQQNASL